MTLASAVALAAALVVIAASRRLGQGWVSPANLYAVAWVAGVIIYELRLLPFYDLSSTTWWIVGAGGAAFLAGSFWPAVAHRARPAASASAGPAVDLYPLARVFFAIGLLGSAVFLWNVHQALGLGIFLESPRLVRQALTFREISSSFLFLYYVGIAGGIVFGYAWLVLRQRPRAIDILLLLAYIVAMVLSTERTHFLWILASWVFLALRPWEGDRRFRQVVATGIVALLVAGPFYLGVGKWVGKSPEYFSASLRKTAVAARQTAEREKAAAAALVRQAESAAGKAPTGTPAGAAATPSASQSVERGRMSWLLPGGPLYRFSVFYLAVAAPLPTLDQAVIHKQGSTLGRRTFRPFVRAFERLGLMTPERTLSVYPDVRTPFAANAYTYLFEFYTDFGWAGVILLPGLIGVLCGVAYARTASARGLSLWPVMLSQLQGMVLWTPFSNRFIATINCYIVVLLLAGIAAVLLWSRRTLQQPGERVAQEPAPSAAERASRHAPQPRDDRTIPLDGTASYFETRFTPDPRRERLWQHLAAYLTRHIPGDARILELGAGYCHFINAVKGRRRVAVDLGEAVTACAAQGVEAVRGDFVEFLAGTPPETFDFILASNVLEHFEWAALDRIAPLILKCLAPGGRLALIQPNFRLAPGRYFDDYTHRTIFTDESLKDWLVGQGFTVVRVVPRFLPLTVKSRLGGLTCLVPFYLRLPWRPMAGQMFVLAERAIAKQERAEAPGVTRP